jgi:hypothetical protein
MTLEEQLNDSESCVELGSSLSNHVFNLFQNTIVRKVSENPASSYQAGKEWSDERFNAHIERLVTAVCQDSYWIDQAVRCWNSSRILPSLELFVGALSDPADYLGAALYWDDKYFEKCGDILVGHVSQSARYSKDIGRLWSQDRFDNYSKLIIDIISTNPVESLEAGKTWPSSRFSNKFVEAVKGTMYEAGALLEWEKTEGLNLTLSDNELELSREAFKFVRGNADLFYDGLWKSIQQGTVKPWAEYIIDHFKKGGIGGGNYREVFS